MYQRNGMFWYRLGSPSGASRRVSLETRDAATAQKVVAWCEDVKDRLDRHGVLDAIITGDVSVAQAFRLGEVACARHLAEARKAAADVALDDALLARWTKWALEEDGTDARTVADYLRQVTTVVPAPRRVSWLETPANVTDALDALACAPTTKQRYRSALGSLCKYLVRRRLLQHNPMPSVPGYGQSTPRMVYYSTEDAIKILHALPQPYRALEALMFACGWEFAACANATVADVNLDTLLAYARGTKTEHRARWTVITQPVVVPWIKEQMRGKLPGALLFPGVRVDTALKIHQKVCRDLGLPVTTNHDWRHTFAVRELRTGRSIQFVAQMLGHADTTMVRRIYGRYVIDRNELTQIATEILRKQA